MVVMSTSAAAHMAAARAVGQAAAGAREAPLSRIHLTNMLALHDAGAVLVPASPGFYHRPASIEELVDQLVTKVLDQLGVRLDLIRRWKA